MIDHAVKLVEIAALFDHVAVDRVAFHLAVTEAPGVAAFRIQPDYPFRTLLNFAQAPVVRQIIVVARVAQHDHGRPLVDRSDMVGHETTERIAEIRMGVTLMTSPLSATSRASFMS